MIYHFVILSPEDEAFCREILIDSENTFEELHTSIQDNLQYDKSQLASFFMLNSEWEKEQEITLVPMDQLSENDMMIMSETKLSDLIKEKKQRLHYLFDYFGNRGFFIELMNIGENRQLASPVYVDSVGNPPEQILIDDLGLDEMAEGMSDEEEEDPFDVGEEFEDIRFDDLSEEDYSQLF